MSTMDSLLARQRTNIRSINRTIENFRKIGKANVTLAITRNRQKILDDHWKTVQSLDAQLDSCVSAEIKLQEQYFVNNEFSEAEEAYFNASDYLAGWAAEFADEPSMLNATIAETAPEGTAQARLPNIELPRFSGTSSEWYSFRDLFKSLIERNKSIRDVQRLHYLNSSLSGEAKDLISTLEITDANYKVAWELLNKRFDNKRVIVLEHLTAILNIPSSTQGTASELKTVRDSVSRAINALTALQRKTDSWDDLLVAIVINKLDHTTRKSWELEQKSTTELTPYSALDTFLGEQIRAIEAYSNSPNNNNKSSTSKPTNSTNKSGNSKTVRSHTTVAAPKTCEHCSGDHAITRCEKFKSQPIEQRLATARQLKCCFNCLRKGHLPANCTSDRKCFICSRKHNTLLHAENAAYYTKPQLTPSSTPEVNTSTASAQPPVVNTHHTIDSFCKRKPILLATAIVTLKATNGRSFAVRALLDQGSDSSFVSESIVQLLRAKRNRISASVEAVGGTNLNQVRSYVSLAVSPFKDAQPVINFDALVYEKISSYQSRNDNLANYSHLQNLSLADPDLSNNEPIDLLIGADIYGSLLRPGLKQGPPGSPTAQLTIFGWVIFGPTQPSHVPQTSIVVHHTNSLVHLHDELRCFWETEEPPSAPKLSEEDTLCNEHFNNSHSVAPDGRYVVRLPFKTEPPAIGHSYRNAMKCFLSLERRLEKIPQLAEQYNDFIHEYEELSHMAIASNTDDSPRVYYLPHHPVIRDDSLTTRLRVVFNASSVTSNGCSLNSQLMTGPKLQPDLLSITIAWRMDKIVFTADIEKMYRQIWLDSRDTNYQRIIWRDKPQDELTVFQLRTLTYGMACAPYLAIRVLMQLSEDGQERFPLASPILAKRFYVDDALFGADNVSDALELKSELIALLATAGLRLRKWATNVPSLLENSSDSKHELAFDTSKDATASVKVLGLRWQPITDSFQFKVNLSIPDRVTKRLILSVIARLYDPFGWLSPVIITAKIMIQELWLRQLDWDELAPDDLSNQWISFCAQLPLLCQLSIPRWTGSSPRLSTYELHGFSDASSRAYAAVVYLHVLNPHSDVQVTLLIAKSKVAPLKQLTIPKLELCAATLLAKLFKVIQGMLQIAALEIHAWTDSQIVLDWISSHPSRWPTFIANRVVEIAHRAPTARWHHIRSANNPADSASRGISPSELISHPLWWTGPPVNLYDKTSWKSNDNTVKSEDESPPATAVLAQLTTVDKRGLELINRLSSWPKVLRVTAYFLRFIAHARKIEGHASLALTSSEIDQARQMWLLVSQQRAFHEEINCLKQNKVIPKQSPLYRLSPRLDTNGLLRLGGRLRHSKLKYDERHPYILPNDRISQLIIQQAHLRALHGGAQLTLSILRETYWIINARKTVNRQIDHCVTCVRNRGSTAYQKMGDLPEVRSTPSRPFSHVGVDYAGPVLVRSSKGRGQKSHKAYIALFVCLSVRSIHLELVNDYSSGSFLAAFQRFTSRRGTPIAMYSDNGTTFQGAEKELRIALQQIQSDTELLNDLVIQGVTWHFIPPSAPHFGGLWEAGVKMTKYHLKRVLGTHTLTYEEFSTLLTRIEACLNSRPIGQLTADPDDYAPLTPGHFLIGAPLTAIPEPSILDINENRLSRWQLIQRMTEHFWRRWTKEYLHTLQQRNKWASPQPNLQVNDLVLIKHDNLPPTRWLIARVLEVYPGSDGLIRVVKVKTANSIFKRPIHHLCKLPVETKKRDNATT